MLSAFGSLAAGLVLVAAPQARATHEAWESPAFQACMGKAAGVTLDMHDCISAEFIRRDGELNAAYKALLTGLDGPPQTDAWRKAQCAWVAFRNAECSAEPSAEIGGSIFPILVDSCATRLTYRRTQDLREAAEAQAQAR